MLYYQVHIVRGVIRDRALFPKGYFFNRYGQFAPTMEPISGGGDMIPLISRAYGVSCETLAPTFDSIIGEVEVPARIIETRFQEERNPIFQKILLTVPSTAPLPLRTVIPR